MKRVKWTDQDGYNHLSLVRDIDPDSSAPRGLLCDPPDINDLNWEEIKKEIWNLLVDRKITSMSGLNDGGLTNLIVVPIRKRLIALYRSTEQKQGVQK